MASAVPSFPTDTGPGQRLEGGNSFEGQPPKSDPGTSCLTTVDDLSVTMQETGLAGATRFGDRHSV